MKFKFASTRTVSTVIASAVLSIGAAGIVGLGSAHASSVKQPAAELVSPPHTSAVYAFYGNGKGQRIWCGDEIEAGKFPVRELSSWDEVNELDMQVGEGRLVKTCDQLEDLLGTDPVELSPELLQPPHTSALYIKYGNGKGQKIWCGDEVKTGKYPVRELSSWDEINELDMQVSEGRLVKTCDQLADLMEMSGPVTTVEEPTTTTSGPVTTVEESTTTTSGPTTTVEESTTTTSGPTTTVEEPTTTTSGPTTTVEEPTTTTSGPTTTVDTDNASDHVTAINVRHDYRLVYNGFTNSHEHRWVFTVVAELDDGTVTRDLDNLYELGIEGSRAQNPDAWGTLVSSGGNDVTITWGNGRVFEYEESTLMEPGTSDQKIDECFDTESSYTVPEGRDAGRLSGTVCFNPDGTFTASADDATGSYSIDKFEIELDFDGGSTVTVPFSLDNGANQVDAIIVGEGIFDQDA